MLSDQNEILHGGWSSAGRFEFIKLVECFRSGEGSKFDLSDSFSHFPTDLAKSMAKG